MARYGTKDGKTYAPNFDSFIEDLGAENFFNIEYGSNERNTHFNIIQRFDFVTKIIQKLMKLGFFKKDRLILESTLSELLHEYGLQEFKFELVKFIMTSYFLSRIWRIFFRFFPFKAVYCSNYANYYGFSLAFSCQELSIPFIDLQHGLQGESHFAYRAFKNHSQKSYNTLPSHFLCWRKIEADYLNGWLGSSGKALVIGFPSARDIPEFEDFADIKMDHKVYFFSVSRENDYETIKKLINISPDSIWLVRLHPSMQNLTLKWEQLLRKELPHARGIYTRLASSMSLLQCLKYSELHFTVFSSVAIEAEMMGVKTIFMDSRSSYMFPDLYRNGMAKEFNGTEKYISKNDLKNRTTKNINFKEIEALIVKGET
jgi:hypothetical protein